MGLLLWGTFAGQVRADSQKVVDINEVRARIAAEHAGWRAGESWVTRLSRDEVKNLLGLSYEPQGTLDFEAAGARATKGAVDWRSKDGINWLGPVMNQGNCGSCVAFATVATLEGQVAISQGAPWLRPTFSPGQLFACGGGGCETGWQPGQAAQVLKSDGIVDEACMPYTSGSTGQDQECSQQCADSGSRTYKIRGSSAPSSYGGSVDKVKAALAHGPLVTTLSVYSDFLTYAGGIYKHVTGAYAGGHAVSLVGYDDAKRAWLIRNSWGQEWGESGFAWVSWDDVSGVGGNTWEFDVATDANALTVATPGDRDYASGDYALTAKRLGTGGGDVTFKVSGTDGRSADVACTTATGSDTCSAHVDTTQMREGRYEIYAQTGASRSQVREFFVINSAPQMAISFQAADGTDLTKPLTGRPEFKIHAQFSPVPIQHVEFRAIDSTGKIAARKSNDYVLEDMQMGWRTMTVPDGHYTLVMHGETTYQGKVYAVDSNTFSVTVKN